MNDRNGPDGGAGTTGAGRSAAADVAGADGLTFGRRLWEARRRAGLSQAEAAGEDLHPSYLSLLEAGKRRPTRNVAAQLAGRLGVSVDWLLTGRSSDHEQRRELTLAFARLALEQGAVATAVEHLEALAGDETLPDDVKDDVALLLGRAHLRLGAVEVAVPILQGLLDRSLSGAGHVPALAAATPLTWLYLQVGSAGRAVEIGLHVLELAREAGLGGTQDYFRLAANVMTGLSARGDDVFAASWAERVIAEAESVGARGGQAALYWNAAVIAERRGRVDEALHLCRRAMGHLSELEDSADLARVQVAAAAILLAAHPPRVTEAQAALERTHDLVLRLGGVADVAEWHLVRSRVALLSGDAGVAREQAEAARASLQGAAAVGELDQTGPVHLALADSSLAGGRVEDAVEELHRARAVITARRVGMSAAYDLRALAERLDDTGLPDLAREAFGLALDAAGVRDRDAPVRAAARGLLAQAAEPSRGTASAGR